MAITDPRLLLILDSRSPAGAHNHSGGMEAAIDAGWVSDVAELAQFCRGRLHTSGLVAAAFAAASCRGWTVGWQAEDWEQLDSELSARMPSAAVRAASRAMGNGLRRLLAVTVEDTDLGRPWSRIEPPAPHHSLVLGAACALTGGSPGLAARAAALGSCTAPASAAVRLLGLDPYAVHGLLADLAPLISQIADAATNAPDLPDDSAPALDLLADVHQAKEVRLFAS
jgi:urease accessory protein